ncbi:MAG: ABC transporter permease [Verrucomicrobia bacterium]|nr:ABC transporter permease [Verrucomicrobiota bacterium]
MLGTYLSKDIRRTCRNPWPYLLSLALPLCVTAIMGLVFGGKSSDSNSLGTIRMAIVDEDKTMFSEMLRSMLNQGEADKHIQVEFLERTDALEAINNNRLSAILVMPRGLTDFFKNGGDQLTFELIKNPAESIHPTLIEEGARVVTTFLNAVARNLREEIPELLVLLEKDGRPDLIAYSRLLAGLDQRFKQADAYLFPPLVQYNRNTDPEESGSVGGEQQTSGDSDEQSPATDVFAFLLIGMGAMFLLFLSDSALRDIYREQRFRTLDRIRTIRSGTLLWLVSKILFAMVLIGLGSLIIFLGGSWMFDFDWRRPLEMSVLTIAYGLFACGLMSLIAALARREKVIDVLSPMIVMVLSLMSGCFFPPEGLPRFFREGVTPWLPNFWYVDLARRLQFAETPPDWISAGLKLAVVGAVLTVIAAGLLQRNLLKGGSA